MDPFPISVVPAKAGTQTPIKCAWTPASAGVTVTLGIVITVLCGCSKKSPPKPPLVETVAVLLFENESNELNADDALQLMVYEALRNSAYRPLDINISNDKLSKAGITDGGQLMAFDLEKIGKDMGVQALLLGDVENYGYVNIGFYQERKVTLNLKMVDATTAGVLWEGSGTGATRKFTLEKDAAAKEFLQSMVEQSMDKLLKSPLQAEAALATYRALQTLPGFSCTLQQIQSFKFEPNKNNDSGFRKFSESLK